MMNNRFKSPDRTSIKDACLRIGASGSPAGKKETEYLDYLDTM